MQNKDKLQLIALFVPNAAFAMSFQLFCKLMMFFCNLDLHLSLSGHTKATRNGLSQQSPGNDDGAKMSLPSECYHTSCL